MNRDHSQDDWLTAYQIADRAKSLQGDARAGFLESACRDRPAVADAVQRVLASVEGSSSWSEHGALDPQDAIGNLLGKTVGEFTIVSELGSGGMGLVFLARQRHPQRDVALKLLRANWKDQTHKRRFEREIRVLASLSHAYIARLYSCGIWERPGDIAVPYYAMEFVPGARDLVRYCREENLGLTERLELFGQVVAAVDHGHANGVVHRDLKPENLLVDGNGLPRVIDFGIARLTTSDAAATRGTLEGAFVGTLAYMAPEQIDRDLGAISERTDVYALGLILYELLCDRPAIELVSETLLERLDELRKFEPRPPSRVRPGISTALDQIYAKAVQRRPEQRYARAVELLQDMQEHLAHRRPRFAPMGSRRTLVRAAALVLLPVAGLVVALGPWWRNAGATEVTAPPDSAGKEHVAKLGLGPLLSSDDNPVDIDLPPIEAAAVVVGLRCGPGTVHLHSGALRAGAATNNHIGLIVGAANGAETVLRAIDSHILADRTAVVTAVAGGSTRLIVGRGTRFLAGTNDDDNYRQMQIGGAGDCSLVVVDGGYLDSQNVLTIGFHDQPGAPGNTRASVSGLGSTLSTWHLRVAENQDASLSILDHGHVAIAHSVVVGYGIQCVGSLDMRRGSLEVLHARGERGEHPPILVIGGNGHARMNMSEGSKCVLGGPTVIAQGTESAGCLQIVGSSLHTKSLILAEGDRSQAQLEIRARGAVRTQELKMGPATSRSSITVADDGMLDIETPTRLATCCSLALRGGTVLTPRLQCDGSMEATHGDVGGDLYLAGSLSVTAGPLNIGRDMTCTPNGLLDLELGDGLQPLLRVTQIAHLAGMFRVRAGAGKPEAGSYRLLTATTIEGTFAHVSLDPALGKARVAVENGALLLVVE